MKHPLLFETENHHWSPNYPKTPSRGKKALSLTFTINGFLLFARRLVKGFFSCTISILWFQLLRRLG